MTFKQVDIYFEEIEDELDDDHDEDQYSVSGTDADGDNEWVVYWFCVNILISFWIDGFILRIFFRPWQNTFINKTN